MPPDRPLLSVISDPRPLPGDTRRHFSLSAWSLVRGSVPPGLATAGQLGGSQAGVRARYALADRLHLAARLSGPLRNRLGKEAAIAIDVTPIGGLPITATIERRVALDGGGRDAFAVGAFGGFDRSIAPNWRLDGYAQAGVVGFRRRDLYVDGSLRAERELLATSRVRIAAGAGLWGGAQPGVARLDVGPQLVARLPIARGGVRLSAEWRARIAGDARPGSGPVVSLGADF